MRVEMNPIKVEIQLLICPGMQISEWTTAREKEKLIQANKCSW
jgi:hypothetical protein